MNHSHPAIMPESDREESRRDVMRAGSRTINVGIIGCGLIAEHYLRYLRAATGVLVVGLSDTLVANAERTARTYGVEHVFASHDELLQLPSLDAVHILTLPEFQYRQASDAIDRGVHLFLEKLAPYHASELEDLYRSAEATRQSKTVSNGYFI